MTSPMCWIFRQRWPVRASALTWENERNGVLTQQTLEAIYQKAGIAIDPLTAPSLDEAGYNNFRDALAQHANLGDNPAPAKIVFLAFRSNGADRDVITLTKLRILIGIEFIKSSKIPMLELDEDRYPALFSHLTLSPLTTGPKLMVYDLSANKVEATLAGTDLSNLTEDKYQQWALNNGTPSFSTRKRTLPRPRSRSQIDFVRG